MGCSQSSEIAVKVVNGLSKKSTRSRGKQVSRSNAIFGECHPCRFCMSLGGFDGSGKPTRNGSMNGGMTCLRCDGKGFISPCIDTPQKKVDLLISKPINVNYEKRISSSLLETDEENIGKSSISSISTINTVCSTSSQISLMKMQQNSKKRIRNKYRA